MHKVKALRRLVWAAGVAVVTALSIVVPAQAADSGPVVFEVQIVRHGVIADCGTFAVNFVANIDAHYEQFFNDSGQLTLERRHVQFTGTLTNATTGATLPYEGNFIRTFDVAAGTVSLIGERRKTEVSGQGVLAIAAGRLVIDTKTGTLISQSGQTDESYSAAICSLLG
jgi:hypothetical protein